MSFNLIHDKWIPVRRQDATQELIAPWELSDKLKSNPIVALDAPRPDFNGALIQFLIGLVQTTMAPENDRAWRKGLTQPPEPSDLKKAFESAASAFNVDGEGARFMQEPTLKAGERHPVSYLLIDAPTKKPREDNTDHFVKRELFETVGETRGLCFSCVSAALFTLQLFGPQGGAGKFVGLRGGGPITTLISGDNLWVTLWLNVLRADDVGLSDGSKDGSSAFDEKIFPWTKPDALVEAITGKSTYLADVHALQMYWAMPRRIRLEFERSRDDCMLCGKAAEFLSFHYQDATSGIHYKPPWRHPLSPHYRNKDGTLLPQHGRANDLSYRHWLGWVLADTSSGEEPAMIVHEFSRRQEWRELHEVLRSGPRLWGFGYDMAKMNARAWCEGIMPLIKVGDADRPVYESTVAAFIRVADWTSESAQIALKRVWQAKPIVKGGKIEWRFTDIKNLPKDELKARERVLTTVARSKALQGTSSRFWQETEADFYLVLDQLREALAQKFELTPIKRRWLARLSKEGESIFDELAGATMVRGADPKRIVLARREMRAANSENNVFVRRLLELPIS